MAIRALGALAAAVILSTASSSWGQEAPDAADDAAGSDATGGDDGAADQDTAPGDADDGGADDSGSAIDTDAGSPSTPSVPASYPVGVPMAPTSSPDPGNGPTTVEAGAKIGPSWSGSAPAAEQIQGLFRPDDGCGGCSTGDTGKSGPLVVVLAALVATWRCRRRPGSSATLQGVPLDLAPEAPQASGPRRRETMEVQMDWLEPSDSQPEADAVKSTKRASARPRKPVIPPLLVAKPRGKLPPPLPRSEPPAASRRTTRPPNRKDG